MFVTIALLSSLDDNEGYLSFVGLEKDATYLLKELGSDKQEFQMSGKTLMNEGLFIKKGGKLNTAVYYLRKI